MSYERKDMSGALFNNQDKKREGKKDPDYRGNATIAGVDYWVDGWIDTPKAGGAKYLSVKFKPKEAKPAPAPEKTASADDFNDSIPF